MSDELLKELARVARERRDTGPLDSRWDGLAAGTLSEEDRRELERLAGMEPEAERAYEAFRPLDASARERIVARLEQELAPEAPGPAKVLPLARKRRWRAVVPALLAAAAGVLLLTLPSRQAGPPLPEYALSFSGVQEVRSSAPEAEVPRLEPGSRLLLLLRPARAVEGPVEVRAFLVRPGEVRAWTPPLEVSPEGAVRIQGLVEEVLPVPPGEWTAAFAVGRPGTLPTGPEALAPFVEGRRAPEPGTWHLLTRRFLLIARP